MEHLVEVIGVNAFKGRIDNNRIDSGKLFSIAKLDTRRNSSDAESVNWKIGHAVEMWKLPNSEMAMRVAILNPSVQKPVLVKIVVERLSNGRETQEVIQDVIPASIDANTGEIKPASAARSEAEGKRSAQRSAA